MKKHCLTCKNSSINGSNGICLRKPECVVNGYKFYEKYKQKGKK